MAISAGQFTRSGNHAPTPLVTYNMLPSVWNWPIERRWVIDRFALGAEMLLLSY